ncbi:hypothetical protein [Sneathiella limimaris]|uniref:hypothetical protein n=1 Tax=Sneathiella limimaris TaxID=1964213 RepID=UPI001469CF0F|nr:hypothetical protein [Sneathiella limimaris]
MISRHPTPQQRPSPSFSTDVRVKGLHGSERSSELVRQSLDPAATLQASVLGCRKNLPAPLPRGERGEREGEHPRFGTNDILAVSTAREVYDVLTGEIKLNGSQLPKGTGVLSTAELWEKTVGKELNREKFIEAKSRERQLREQSFDIARRLESEGIPAYQQDNSTTIIGLCSGEVEKANHFRNSNIIPSMQARNVHDMLRHVRYFMDNSNRRHLRMLVISNGWVPLSSYRNEHKAFTRKISKISADPVLKERGIQFVYYNVENTIKRASDNDPHLNMHSHVLMRSTKRLGPKKWAETMEFIKSRFDKGYAHDERIRNPAECVKYVFKPCEFDLLTNGELKELFLQTCRLKFFHPLGPIREFRRKLREDRLKLVKAPDQNGRWGWNVQPKARTGAKQERNESGETQDIVVAITNPMPKFTRRYEPCLIVRNFSGNLNDLIRKRQLDKVQTQALRLWRESASMKHTTTTTVLDPLNGRETDHNNYHSNHQSEHFQLNANSGKFSETPGEHPSNYIFQ